MASEKIQTLTDTNFDETVIKSTGPVLVDFLGRMVRPVPSLGPRPWMRSQRNSTVGSRSAN